MRLFHWLCAEEIPPGCDLRLCGWHLAPRAPARQEPEAIGLARAAGVDPPTWERLLDPADPPARARVLLFGVGDGHERARLLELGFGEVTSGDLPLRELEVRAARVAGSTAMVPRKRDHGDLTLDLMARDGFAAGRRLGFHPREFALLWRLAETPGIAVGKATLLREVWRLLHVPETNSLAVHVSRLRTKLALAGLDELLQTAPTGGYLLVPQADRRAVPLPRRDGERHDHVYAAAEARTHGEHPAYDRFTNPDHSGIGEVARKDVS